MTFDILWLTPHDLWNRIFQCSSCTCSRRNKTRACKCMEHRFVHKSINSRTFSSYDKSFFWRNPLTFLCCGRICHDVCRFHCLLTQLSSTLSYPSLFSTQYAAFRSHATDLGRGWQCLLFASQSYKNVMSIRLWAGFQLKTDFMGMIQSPEDASKHADIGDT